MTTDTTVEGVVTRRLAAEWSGLRPGDLPADARDVAGQCLLDWFACALAGSREPLSEILVREVAATDGGEEATLVGRRRRVSARTAALVNGAAGHALDFDDTHLVMSGHPSVPVVPAALATAERVGAGGSALLAAVVAGIEVECRVGALLNPEHYLAGWHATGTVGVFGAAAAAAHLLGLGADAFATALALAGTQAAGVKASFGTMAKPLHPGKAASDGLLAAVLAAGGFTANPEVLEAPEGLGRAAGGVVVDRARLDRYEGRFLVRDTLFKYHAACYLTHAAINAALQLRPEVTPGDVAGIEVRVAPECLGVCNIERPATGLEGKFSLRTTTAMALLGDDTAALGAYTDARMADAELVALRDRVAVVPTEGLPTTRSTVAVTTVDGRRLEAEDDTGVPAADLGRQRARLEAKFGALAAPVLGDDGARQLVDAIAGVEDLGSVRDLLAPATPPR